MDIYSVDISGLQDKTKEIANLNQQLGLLDLKVVPVTADGNCFFRYMKTNRSLLDLEFLLN